MSQKHRQRLLWKKSNKRWFKKKKHFDVELTSFDTAKKLSIIKEIKNTLGIGLKDAKEMVEKAPFVFKEKADKESSEELKEKFEKLGAVITLK